jgi:hypothetical protein
MTGTTAVTRGLPTCSPQVRTGDSLAAVESRRSWSCLFAAAVLPLLWLPVAAREIVGTDGFPGWFWPVHLTVMAYGLALIVVSIRLVLRNRDLSDGQRAGWLFAVILMSPPSLIAYLVTHRPAPTV